ncbi:Transcription factor [Pleurostoma richardsiae]|uniref:Transcription factor n=1 Tax=Pleurostoma richardsiae TaxID=41990 RepID=A0AA38RA72_9PEZI|nr:Transcription factor [Pleurostoma richardsiae]
MNGRNLHTHPTPRPYRSKRHRPCDLCRRRKHACIVEDEPPCRVCRELGTSCTFKEPPGARRRRQAVPLSAGPTPQLAPEPVTVASGITRSGVTDSEELLAGSWQLDVDDERVDADRSGHHARQALLDYHVGSFLGSPAHDTWFAASPFFYPSLGTGPILADSIGESNYQQESFPGVINHSQSNSSTTQHQVQLDSSSHDLPQDPGRTDVSGPRKSRDASAPSEALPSWSLDMGDGGWLIQYFGLSGEMDPYLLQFMEFSSDGTCNLGPFQYRRLGGGIPGHDQPPASAETPVYFMTSAAKPVEQLGDDDAAKEDCSLEQLVPAAVGSRLIGLFLRYTFPNLPVISRSHVKIWNETLIPKDKHLAVLPSYLLAAVYASAEPFRRYDPILSVSQVNNEFPHSKLWRLAHRGIMENLRTPRLAVIQAILIYLQRPMDETATATTDASGQNWALLGSAVHMAYQLGLHIDCKDWPLHMSEKRLRRRLWWVLHCESTWHSLLLGLPQPIPHDQWDVADLGDSDFVIDHYQCPAEYTFTKPQSLQKPCVFCHRGHDFHFLASLSVIAQEVSHKFYTLMASKRLADDFKASLVVGRSLLERIRQWKSRLPAYKMSDETPTQRDRDYFHSGSSAQLRLACLTLEILVYRAMLRPLSRQNPASTGETRGASEPPTLGDQRPVHGLQVARAADVPSGVLDLFLEAIDTAHRAMVYAQRLGSYDLNSFTYSWSRACFASVSNFIMLLLVLAPSAEMTRDVLSILAKWVIMLREQCITFSLMRLGLLRLDSIFQMGLEHAFRFRPYAKQMIQQELPTPNYKK